MCNTVAWIIFKQEVVRGHIYRHMRNAQISEVLCLNIVSEVASQSFLILDLHLRDR